jgi:hypothetical protein
MIELRLDGAPDMLERGAELGCGWDASAGLDTALPITAVAVSDGELVDTFYPSP